MKKYFLVSLLFVAALAAAPPVWAGVEPADGGILFTFHAPGASSVNLAGEMNAWSATATPLDRSENGAWAAIVPLDPGMYRYKFVVDGNNWKEDPDNPTRVDDNYGGFNSLVVVLADGSLSFREEDREIRTGDDYEGSGGTVYLNLIWHQHQPLYLDPAKDELQGPWVRAHGTKDYYDMAAILEEYPDVHYNVNLTSVLLFQLQKYYVDRLGPYVDPVENRVDAKRYLAEMGGRTDPWIDMALKNSAGFGKREDRLLYGGHWNSFGISDVMIDRFPEYRALREKGGGYTVDEKRAIKFWHYLAWFDPDFLRGAVRLPAGWTTDLSDLVSEEEDGTFLLRRPVTEADANRIVAESWKVLASIVPVHRKLMYDRSSGSGQIEVMTTPYYHPILPLLVDTETARVCQGADRLPERFARPEDAVAQVAKAVSFYESLFGRPPRGMWPGEGSVSEAIVPVLASNGIEWMATADGVLERSLPSGMPLERPYRVEAGDGERSGAMAVVFRDTPLSDRIGFRYQRLFGEEAADDFIREVLKRAPGPDGDGEDRLLTVILDGENAWEWYVRDNDAKDFLNALYRKLTLLYEERRVVTVTMSEYIAGNEARGVAPHPVGEMALIEKLWPGSWIGADFSTWIGEGEENAAWELLARTRDYLESTGIPAPDPASPLPGREEPGYAAAMAWEEMYAAEGSDWFWWYGSDQNAPGGDEPFDVAYRTHIANVYRYAAEAGAAGGIPEIGSLLGAAHPISSPGGTMARGDGGPVTVLFTCDAAGRNVTDAIYIVGNRPELAEWTPNKVRMYDDGSHGDETAEDGVWSIEFRFAAGTRVEYKYTDSGDEGVWSPSEEFPVTNRTLDVLPAGALKTSDRFGEM